MSWSSLVSFAFPQEGIKANDDGTPIACNPTSERGLDLIGRLYSLFSASQVMHPAWNIAELRLAILEYLDPQDLTRLAQTCSTLRDSAINELWRVVESPAQLVSCLPEDFRSRPLRLEEIARLDRYACKVEAISWAAENNSGGNRLPKQFSIENKNWKTWEQLWKEIADLRPNSQFLPNLRRLRIHGVHGHLLWPFVGISGQKLTQVQISVIRNPYNRMWVSKLLESLHNFSKLEYLFVRNGRGEGVVPSRLIQEAPLKHLRGTHGPFRVEILQTSTLKHLDLDLTDTWHTPEVHSMEEKYLPSLRKLWLKLPNFTPSDATSWSTPGSPRSTDVYMTRALTTFLRGLDEPRLELLEIKLPSLTSGSQFLDIVSTANSSCRLRNLEVLSFPGEYIEYSGTKISPSELRKGLRMLLPLPQLKVLEIGVAPNFLDILDLRYYSAFADGLPALKKLSLGHYSFATCSPYHETVYHEKVPLLHLAAFCTMLPGLEEVSLGCADVDGLNKPPRWQLACPHVKRLNISHWAGTCSSYACLRMNMDGYFPNSDLTKKGVDSRFCSFEQLPPVFV